MQGPSSPRTVKGLKKTEGDGIERGGREEGKGGKNVWLGTVKLAIIPAFKRLMQDDS